MLQGKVAVVTGSTSGIGLGIASALAAEGAAIMLNGFGDAGAIERLQRDLAGRHGVKIGYSTADMSKPAQIREMIAQAQDELGSVDILVNNAGIQHVAPVESFPDDKWDAIIAINLSAAFHASKAAIPGMKRRGWGRIINIASTHGLVASAEKAAYVAAKHGVIGLTKVVAIEGRQQRHHLQRDLPGLGADAAGAAAGRGARPGEGPDGRAGASARCWRRSSRCCASPRRRIWARWPAFLCSDAATTMTGEALPMDGGWLAQ